MSMKVPVATFCGNEFYVGRSVSSSETSRDVPEDGNFHNHGSENLKCCAGHSFPTGDIEYNMCRLGVFPLSGGLYNGKGRGNNCHNRKGKSNIISVLNYALCHGSI